jgi:glycosyltransferase involved in cell wall biosynthesis
MFEQLRELRDQYGFEVTALVSGERGALIDRLDSEGIPHFAANFEFATLRGMMRMPIAIFKMARFFRQHRFDVVQTHIFITMIFGRIAAWLADVPVRLSMIAGPFHLEAYTSRWIDRSTYWMESMLIPSCEKSLQLCREMGVREERLSLIYYSADERNFDPRQTSPIDIRKRYGWPPETPVIGMVAYFYPRLSKSRWIPAFLYDRGIKGHEDLINAAPTILAEFPEAKFLLVGSGWGEAGEAYRKEVKELVRSLGLEESIVFAGYHPDVNSVLSEVDVAVQASLSENLGGTLEALLMERPLVATRVGGMVDVVREGETGVLVDPSSPDDLARGIVEMLRDPERARALGRAGRELILERFSLRRTVDDLAELYERLASKEKKRRKFYNPLASLLKLVVVVPVIVYLAFRLLFLDMYLPIYLPIHLARIRAVPVRLYYRVRLYAYRVRGLLIIFYYLIRSAAFRALGALRYFYLRLRGVGARALNRRR